MLVGRSQELGILNAQLNEMLSGKGSILFLTGEAGLGKTTLVHEWWKSVATDTAIYTEAACSIPIGNMDVGRLEALQPWADIIAQLQVIEGEKKKKLDLKKLIYDAAPAWAWAIPVVGGLVHAALETAQVIADQRPATNVNAQNQQQVFQQYVNLISKIAEQTPLVVLLDDMQWSDTSSINLLFYLSRQITSKRILVLATYRPEEAALSNNGKGHPVISVKNEIIRYESGKEMALGYLGGDAIQELLTKTFNGYTVDGTFEGWLKKISDGNSLFVTQFIKTLREDGYLDERGSFIGDYNKISIPASALAVVEERTRRLDKDTRELLRYATAEGEEFTSYVLSHITQKKPMELLQELRKAESAEVVRSKGSTRMYANQTTMIYGYSHALFHKALYESLYDQEKEILHRECYTLLKTEWDREAGIHPITLATKLLLHSEKCGEWKTGADAAFGAALSAWRNYSESEALEMLRNVLRLADIDPANLALLRIDALLLQADIHKLHGRNEDSLAAARQAQELSAALHDDARTARAINFMGLVSFNRGAYNEALKYHAEALAVWESIGDRKGVAWALGNIGNVHDARGAYAEALEYNTKSLVMAESIDDRVCIASSLNNIGILHFNHGEYGKALEYYTKSLAIKEAIGDRAGIVNSTINIGIVYLYRGEYEEALEFNEKSRAMAETIGNHFVIARALANIGNVHGYRGANDKALEYYAKALPLQESIGDRLGIATTLVNVGVVHRKQKNLHEARAVLTKAKNITAEMRSKEYVAETICELGLLCEAEAMQSASDARNEKMSEAKMLLEEGLTILKEIKSGEAKRYETELERVKKLAP